MGRPAPIAWVPDAVHEALRDLVRAREAAKKDQLRARHRLGKCEHPAQEAAFLDYSHEVEHMAERVARLERAIDQAIAAAPLEMKAVIAGLQALRGIKAVSAATIVAEAGPLSRFARPKQLMGYSGMVSSEDSTGSSVAPRGDHQDRQRPPASDRSVRRLGPTSTGRRCRPCSRSARRGSARKVKEIAWKAQHRLSSRYRRLIAKGKLRQKVTTAIGRELLGFTWAIGGREGAVPPEAARAHGLTNNGVLKQT